jgi:hypothetical protein
MSPEAQEPLAIPTVGDLYHFGGHVWRVLDIQNDRALLLSEYIIEARHYHDWDSIRQEVWQGGLGLTWEISDIRWYLNNEFLNNTFTASERNRIAQTNIKNNDNPWWTDWMVGGPDTQDRIFLLSIEEVVRYFGDSGQIAFPLRDANEHRPIDDQFNSNRTAYALPIGLQTLDWGYIPSDSSFIWWLRSPGFVDGPAFVCFEGLLYVSGDNGLDLAKGVRPALWLNLE